MTWNEEELVWSVGSGGEINAWLYLVIWVNGMVGWRRGESGERESTRFSLLLREQPQLFLRCNNSHRINHSSDWLPLHYVSLWALLLCVLLLYALMAVSSRRTLCTASWLSLGFFPVDQNDLMNREMTQVQFKRGVGRHAEFNFNLPRTQTSFVRTVWAFEV